MIKIYSHNVRLAWIIINELPMIEIYQGVHEEKLAKCTLNFALRSQ